MPDEGMPRKRLIDYLPPFMQDFAEIKAIMKTENPELDQAWLAIRIPLADAFIMDCDEYALKNMNRLLVLYQGRKIRLMPGKQGYSSIGIILYRILTGFWFGG